METLALTQAPASPDTQPTPNLATPIVILLLLGAFAIIFIKHRIKQSMRMK
ncbi:hypothetical protein [Gehongia tenuis]|uniref:LPXTG cell wall anchor domain-containing protein n=1 Tax=Gehongia tenuis TaxID=2763655 RepID=A0A926D448_9FIRM|nr:hypothetical protein [Gehongia tenuis]MBC8531398.1 hypothetical protein [Gehongia tenuis]